MKWLFNRIFRSHDFLPNIFNTKFKKTVVILYKTYPFFNPEWRWWSHTNNWEISEIVNIFHKKEYNVYLIDRSIQDFKQLSVCLNPTLFIGLNGCGSGRQYFSLLEYIKPNLKIMLTTIEHPAIQRKTYLKCYSLFEAKTGINLAYKRLIPEHEVIQYNLLIEKIDAFFAIASPTSLDGYLATNKPLYQWTPAIYNKLSFIKRDFLNNSKRYLFISGSGLVEKGLDSCIEVFSAQKMFLDICAPDKGYDDFWTYYSPLLGNNIVRHGFVDIKSNAFKRIAADCHFVISNSVSEGFNTAISTAMRTGLIPILTNASGHGKNSYSIAIKDDSQGAILEALRIAEKIPSEDLLKMSEDAYSASLSFDQKNFSLSFNSCLNNFEEKFKI